MAAPNTQANLKSFRRRLWLGSGRDQIPEGALRRCVGAAGEPEESVRSKWGSTLLYGIQAISLTKFNNIRYQYDGGTLYSNGAPLDVGYNGNRLVFVKAPPALGVPDYLFETGGGKFRKIDGSNRITNWGIDAPIDGMQARPGLTDTLVIDNFNTNPAAAWTSAGKSPVNATISNETNVVYEGTGSLKIVPSAGPWTVTKYLIPTLNLGLYADNVVSLQTDYVSMWVNIKHPNRVIWMWIMLDLLDGSFKSDYYKYVIQLVPTTLNTHAANAQTILTAPSDSWFQLALAKSDWLRVGTNLNLDWQNVQAIRVTGGFDDTPPLPAVGPFVYIDNFTMFGGYPLGAGPAALMNGSTLQYLVTYGNDTTGNDSNPNDTPILVQSIKEQPVQLANIPTSTDTQVTNRKLWRTSEGGALFFFLDRIPDNFTTTYTDIVSSISAPKVLTPWVATKTYLPLGLVDEGNGFYAQTVAGGTSGTTAPNWVQPNIQWSSKLKIDVAGEVTLPLKTFNHSSFIVITPGQTGLTEPVWTSVPLLGQQITDGTVVWQNNGPLITTDGLITWVTQGLNSLQTLGATQVRYDNIIFPNTAQDAAYFEGSMYVARDTANPSFVYISPPGRSEGYGQILQIGTNDDPIQKLISWDEILWVVTTKYWYPLSGVYPSIAVGDRAQGALGTSFPFSLKETPYGIVYQSAEDIRIFNRARDEALAFEPLAPIQRGQGSENVRPFTAVIAEHCKDEVLFSDLNGQVLGYSFAGQTWRMTFDTMLALYYEDDTGIIQATTQTGGVVSWENQGSLTEANGSPVQIEWQTPSILLNEGQFSLVQRAFIDINCAGQVITPTLILDDTATPNEITLPAITNTARKSMELAIQKSSKIFGVRLTGNVLARVHFFGLALDLDPSES